MRRLITVIVAALVVATAVTIPAIGAGPFTAEQSAKKDRSQDRLIRSLTKKLNRVNNRAKQGVGQSEEAIDQANKMEKVVSDAAWDVRHDIQVVNGRVSTLPDSFNDNKVHEHRVLVQDIPNADNSSTPDTNEAIPTIPVHCETGESVVSGGFRIRSTNQGLDVPQPQIVEARITSDITYSVTVNNLNAAPTAVPVDLDVYAYCIAR